LKDNGNGNIKKKISWVVLKQKLKPHFYW